MDFKFRAVSVSVPNLVTRIILLQILVTEAMAGKKVFASDPLNRGPRIVSNKVLLESFISILYHRLKSFRS